MSGRKEPNVPLDIKRPAPPPSPPPPPPIRILYEDGTTKEAKGVTELKENIANLCKQSFYKGYMAAVTLLRMKNTEDADWLESVKSNLDNHES
jgi:hypothetical protein